MKMLLVCWVMIGSVFFARGAKAEFALGAVLGDPTGFSGRWGLSDQNSLEAALAYSSSSYEGLHAHVSYLWDHARSIKTSVRPIEMYYGLGLRIISITRGKYDGDTSIGPRAPVGLLYIFQNPNIEVFGELALTLDITPRTEVDLDAGIGARIRF